MWSGEVGQPGGVPDAGRDLQPRPGTWVPEQGTWDVLCGKCQWGGPEGQSGPERRMPVRQLKVGTTAGVPYDGLRHPWAETAVMPVRQQKAGTMAGVP